VGRREKDLGRREGGMRHQFELMENDSGLNLLRPRKEAWDWKLIFY
jgi:hypothetical protein